MTDLEKINLIANALDIMDTDLTEGTELNSFKEWDSMGIVSIMAMFDRSFAMILSVDEIQQFRTLGDIMARMNEE